MTRFAGTVTVNRTGSLAIVEWDRSPLNVFTARLLRDLSRTLRSVDVTTANVVVLRGGGKCWSAGLDVAEHLMPVLPEMLGSFRDALRTLWDLPVPTIAQVHGACLGGGLELLAACDLAISDPGATFGQPEIRLGVFPPFAAAHYPTAYGPRATAELLYTAAPVQAPRALQMGLINHIASESLEQETLLLADQIASTRREALVALKRILHSAPHAPWDALAAAERVYVEELMADPQAEEGLRAFLEKRKPQWRTASPDPVLETRTRGT